MSMHASIKRQKKVNKHFKHIHTPQNPTPTNTIPRKILRNIKANANKPWESKFNSVGSNEAGGKRGKVQ